MAHWAANVARPLVRRGTAAIVADMVDSMIYHCGAASGLFNGTAPSAFELGFKLMRMRSVTGECQSLSSWSAIGEYIMMKVLLVA